MTDLELDAYLLCATPRTGSTLLCGLLESSGVAGRPASYFNRLSLDDYAEAWGITRPPDGRIDDRFVAAARTAGTTPNGVFAGRIMAATMPELVSDLRATAGQEQTDVDLLRSRLGRLGIVHLRRGDVVAQAVSWARALQTHFWHPDEAVTPGGRPPQYDADLIGRLVASITGFEADWAAWFAANGVEPCEVTYEELSADPVATARRVLDFLGLELLPDRPLVVGHQKQADELNADWIRRFGSR